MDQRSDQLTDGQRAVFDGREATVSVTRERRRLGLTIERDGRLVVRTPLGAGFDAVDRFVRENRRWIDAKLELWRRHRPLNSAPRLAEGELFRYLGREYRLALTEASAPPAPVRLVAGQFLLDARVAEDPVLARAHLRRWYREAGADWSRGRLQPWAGRMEVAEPRLVVRDVGKRWGTYRAAPEPGGSPGVMALHWGLFQLPPRLIDYVIAHELAHIRVSGHGPDYWRLLRRAIPECESLKAELDEMGRHVWLGDLGR
ncbi:M48 family metallopeptidase [Streptomyces tardus]|uniref:M48 family metallopeptidase n=1 Tax=Streptomyces tardus TaxID=2780544 RepID=UPI0027E3D294|nr:SprT family zinc-dependent metalloprotease [Streptomyces tardus]